MMNATLHSPSTLPAHPHQQQHSISTPENNSATASSSSSSALQVVLRIQPPSKHSISQSNSPSPTTTTTTDVLKVLGNTLTLLPHQKKFTFDHVFDSKATQENVFSEVAASLVDRFIQGSNVAILAYGQASSGKTYTIGTAVEDQLQSEQGLLPRAMATIFQNIEPSPIVPTTKRSSSASTSINIPRRAPSTPRLRTVSIITQPTRHSSTPTSSENSKTTRHTIHVSFVEINGNDTIDLLNTERPVTTLRDPKGQTTSTSIKEVPVTCIEDVIKCLHMGAKNRTTHTTHTDTTLSSSHTIFTVLLKQEKWVPKTETKPATSTPVRKPEAAAPSVSTITRRTSALNVKAMIGHMERQAKNIEEEGEWITSTSKLHFVDLADAEDVKEGRDPKTLTDNGLSALSDVLSALSDPFKKTSNVPYHDSKLTQILQNPLESSTDVLMIACIRSAGKGLKETLNTLHYTDRSRNIKETSESLQKEEEAEAEAEAEEEEEAVAEWMTNENPEVLRTWITKLKAQMAVLQPSSSSPSPEILAPAIARLFNSHCPRDTHSFASSLTDSEFPSHSSSTTTIITVPETTDFDQQCLVADLRRQIEELYNQVSVARERRLLEGKTLHVSHPPPRLVPSRPGSESSESTKSSDYGEFQHIREGSIVLDVYGNPVTPVESPIVIEHGTIEFPGSSPSSESLPYGMQDYEPMKKQETAVSLNAHAIEHSISLIQDQVKEKERVRVHEKETAPEKKETKETKETSPKKNKVVQEQSPTTDPNPNQSTLLSHVRDLENQLFQSAQEAKNTERMIRDLEQRLLHCKNAEAVTGTTVRSLEARLKTAEQQHTQMSNKYQKEIEKSQQECQSLHQQMNKAKVANELSQQDQHAFKGAMAKVTDLELQVRTKTTQMRVLQEQLDDIDRLRKDWSVLKDAQVAQIQHLEVTLETLKTKYTSCIKELQDAQTEFTKHQHTWKLTQQELENEKATLKTQVEEGMQTNEILQRHMWDHEQGTQITLRLRLQELEKVKLDLNALRLVEEKQDIIIRGLEAKVIEMERLTVGLREQLVDRETYISSLEKENQIKTEASYSMQREMEGILREVSSMSTEKQQFEMVLRVVENSMQIQGSRSDRTFEAFKDILHQCNLREENWEKSQGTIEHLKSEQEVLSQCLQEAEQLLETERHQSKASIESQRMLIQTLKDEKEQIEVELQCVPGLEAYIKELNEASQERDEKHQALLFDLESKNSEIAKAQQHAERQESKMYRLEATVEELKKIIGSERSIVAANDTSGMIYQLENKLAAMEKERQTVLDDWEDKYALIVDAFEQTKKEKLHYQNVIQSLQSSEDVSPMSREVRRTMSEQQVLYTSTSPTSEITEDSEASRIVALEKKIRLLEQEKRTLARRSLIAKESSEKTMLQKIEEQQRELLEKDAAISRLNSRIRRFSYRDPVSQKETMEEFQAQLGDKLLDRKGQQELIKKLSIMAEDNSDLMMHVDDLEAQMVLQRSQLTLEIKNLELELMKQTSANDRLEKEMEHIIPRYSMSTPAAIRDSVLFTSPPMSPRVGSPAPIQNNLLHKMQREISNASTSGMPSNSSSANLIKAQKSSHHASLSFEQEQEASKQRFSVSSVRSDMTHPGSSLRHRSTNGSVQNLPPPTAPPSNPLPPIPTPLPALPESPVPSSPPHSPILPVRTVSLLRNDSTSSGFSEIMNSINGGTMTSEKYEKIFQTLQRKSLMAENDVKAHQEVISKLESQLTRSESSVRDAKKQLDVLNRERQAYTLEIQNLRTQVTQIQTHQQTNAGHIAEERKMLEEELEAEKRLKEKAEKARHILENRMEELMNKKNKFMCF